MRSRKCHILLAMIFQRVVFWQYRSTGHAGELQETAENYLKYQHANRGAANYESYQWAGIDVYVIVPQIARLEQTCRFQGFI